MVALWVGKWKYAHCMSFQKMHSEEHKTSDDSWRIKEAGTKW